MKNEIKYIFKVCRVHNIEDLNIAKKNNVNMIGIHAVYFDRNAYLISEEKYKPIIKDYGSINENIPVSTLEVNSIRAMQKYLTDEIKQVILFQRETEITIMKKCCEIYGMKTDNIYIQLHHRTSKKYIENVKRNLCKNIIAVVGIFQEDFCEYFWQIHNSLNKDTDYILVDLSEHQSDLSVFDENTNKIKKIRELAKAMEGNIIPILIADDTDVKTMKKYLNELLKYNILIRGLDMQNAVEYAKINQCYTLNNKENITYQQKKRKSEKLFYEWNNFFRIENKKYFK